VSTNSNLIKNLDQALWGKLRTRPFKKSGNYGNIGADFDKFVVDKTDSGKKLEI
jgi:Na+-transporting NADH:ubiquinone oxidoreductase subunit NqrA